MVNWPGCGTSRKRVWPTTIADTLVSDCSWRRTSMATPSRISSSDARSPSGLPALSRNCPSARASSAAPGVMSASPRRLPQWMLPPKTSGLATVSQSGMTRFHSMSARLAGLASAHAAWAWPSRYSTAPS
ncbi:hypothetical protein [Janthinobacterium agaricidamnosum]|uniref:hypothetical protein n=1 Tax=Janthinobacterium agaricidamnosum TaxID=55508 RepID=UPI00068E905F|nr:hypothetical protein [Janthinobacterium agaricidamnosum]